MIGISWYICKYTYIYISHSDIVSKKTSATSFLMLTSSTQTIQQSIYGICSYIYYRNKPNVGTYICPMDDTVDGSDITNNECWWEMIAEKCGNQDLPLKTQWRKTSRHLETYPVFCETLRDNVGINTCYDCKFYCFRVFHLAFRDDVHTTIWCASPWGWLV